MYIYIYIYPPAPPGHTAAKELNQTSISFSFSFSFSLSFSFSFFSFSFFSFFTGCLLICLLVFSVRLLRRLLVCLFAPLVCLLVGSTVGQFTTQNHVALLLGLPEFACGPSAVHIFGFEPYQARTYTHQTCHSTAICPKPPQSGTKVPPKCSKVTPKCPPRSAKLSRQLYKTIIIHRGNGCFLKIGNSDTKATFIHPKVTAK